MGTQTITQDFAETGPPRSWQRQQPTWTGAGTDGLATALGWFSIGLGVAEIAAPRRLGRLIGVDANETLFRLLGAREIAAGLGILTQRRPAGWMWSRVAGDAMDMALLGMALTSSGSDRGRAVAALAAVAGVTALDVLSGKQLQQGRGQEAGLIRAYRSVTIHKPVEEVYNFWRELTNLPMFMKHLASVRKIDDRRSHWVAKAPAGRTVEWDAETIEDRANDFISWQSLPGADVDSRGSVRFRKAQGDKGTVLSVSLEYQPPAGAAGALFAKLFGEEPSQQLDDDLRRIKQVLETGEIATTEGQTSGRKQK